MPGRRCSGTSGARFSSWSRHAGGCGGACAQSAHRHSLRWRTAMPAPTRRPLPWSPAACFSPLHCRPRPGTGIGAGRTRARQWRGRDRGAQPGRLRRHFPPRRPQRRGAPGRCHQGRAACRQNLLPYLETRIVEGAKGRTLEIAPKRGYEPVGSAPITISVDLPSLRGVSIAGSGKARGDGLRSAAWTPASPARATWTSTACRLTSST